LQKSSRKRSKKSRFFGRKGRERDPPTDSNLRYAVPRDSEGREKKKGRASQCWGQMWGGLGGEEGGKVAGALCQNWKKSNNTFWTRKEKGTAKKKTREPLKTGGEIGERGGGKG